MNIETQIEAARRELDIRVHCYPKWILQGRLTTTKATHEIEAMQSILETLHIAKQKGWGSAEVSTLTRPSKLESKTQNALAVTPGE